MDTKPASFLCELVGRLANTTLTIRIYGETGVGKEAVARLLYRYHPHDNATFRKVDCQRLGTSDGPKLLEELNPILDAPQGNVFYLENMGAAPQQFQNRLLELFKKDIRPNPPWIIASSIDPWEMLIKQGRLSKPLFKELDTLHIELPPIRSMPKKISQMLSWFLSNFNSETPSRTLPMPALEEMERLVNHAWPGNWRQLQMVARKAFIEQTWNVPFYDSESQDGQSDGLDSVAAIYILSMAKLGIQKSKVIEGMVSASNQDDLGFLDLAIFNEAVDQMTAYIRQRAEDEEN